MPPAQRLACRLLHLSAAPLKVPGRLPRPWGPQPAQGRHSGFSRENGRPLLPRSCLSPPGRTCAASSGGRAPRTWLGRASGGAEPDPSPGSHSLGRLGSWERGGVGSAHARGGGGGAHARGQAASSRDVAAPAGPSARARWRHPPASGSPLSAVRVWGGWMGRMASEMESSLEVSLSNSCVVSGASGCLPPARSRIFKIIVIGDSNVGKTCLTYRFCAGRFPDRTEATIGVDFRERAVDIDGERIKIQLWDTAGQERFRKSMVQHYYRNVHAVVFVYDVTNMASFHSLPAWIEECKQHLLAGDIPRILVGNKCDLRSAVQVPTDLAQKFADTHSMPLFETSAKNPHDNDHVEAIFMTLAHKLKSHKPLMLSQPPEDSVALKPEARPALQCWC